MFSIIFDSFIGLFVGEYFGDGCLELGIKKTFDLVHEEDFLDKVFLLEFFSQPISLDCFFSKDELTWINLARFQLKCSIDIDGGIFRHSSKDLISEFSSNSIEGYFSI